MVKLLEVDIKKYFFGIYIFHSERFYTVIMWSRCDSNRDWLFNGNPRTRNGSFLYVGSRSDQLRTW